MYIVKRYAVSKARERLADVLDEADRTGAVLIERGNAQYIITAKPQRIRQAGRQSSIESLDQSVKDGQWRWDWTSTGVRFAGRRRRS